MSETKQVQHTPGPWVWDGRWLNAPHAPMHGAGDTVLWYTTDDDGVHCSEADARLIAAAPDLLAACEAALAWVMEDSYVESKQPFNTGHRSPFPGDVIRDAIAKARPQ